MKQKNIILSITSGLTLLFFLPLSMAMNNAVYINNWGPLLGGIVLVSLLASVLLFAACLLYTSAGKNDFAGDDNNRN